MSGRRLISEHVRTILKIPHTEIMASSVGIKSVRNLSVSAPCFALDHIRGKVKSPHADVKTRGIEILRNNRLNKVRIILRSKDVTHQEYLQDLLNSFVS